MRMAEIQVAVAEQAARSGADVVCMGGDVATQQGPMMSPKMWRHWIFPMMCDCIRAAKAANPDVLIDFHSCGNVTALVDGLVEAGIDILNPCQPEAMDIFELKRRYGDRLSFHGGIGVQSATSKGQTPQPPRDRPRKPCQKAPQKLSATEDRQRQPCPALQPQEGGLTMDGLGLILAPLHTGAVRLKAAGWQ